METESADDEDIDNFSLYEQQATVWDPADRRYRNRDERKRKEDETVESAVFCCTKVER